MFPTQYSERDAYFTPIHKTKIELKSLKSDSDASDSDALNPSKSRSRIIDNCMRILSGKKRKENN